MSRIDIVKLRKTAGMSQRDLAASLQVRPSFLSAIENGKSRLPDEKLDKIKEIFNLENFDGYILDDAADTVVASHSHVPPHTHILPPAPDSGALERIELLTKRNDRLSQRVDDLRDEVDRLREENLRLKELLVKNGIDY